MVALKKRNPQLKIILSLGGWGGCETCSDVFSTKKGRKKFSKSAKKLCDYFGTDGIDLDWEYPTISGFPGHPYGPQDKPNFTALIKQLRKKLGKKKGNQFCGRRLYEVYRLICGMEKDNAENRSCKPDEL